MLHQSMSYSLYYIEFIILDKGNNKDTHKEKEIYKNMNDKKGVPTIGLTFPQSHWKQQ
jgi:hypothetical protein